MWNFTQSSGRINQKTVYVFAQLVPHYLSGDSR